MRCSGTWDPRSSLCNGSCPRCGTDLGLSRDKETGACTDSLEPPLLFRRENTFRRLLALHASRACGLPRLGNCLRSVLRYHGPHGKRCCCSKLDYLDCKEPPLLPDPRCERRCRCSDRKSARRERAGKSPRVWRTFKPSLHCHRHCDRRPADAHFPSHRSFCPTFRYRSRVPAVHASLLRSEPDGTIGQHHRSRRYLLCRRRCEI